MMDLRCKRCGVSKESTGYCRCADPNYMPAAEQAALRAENERLRKVVDAAVAYDKTRSEPQLTNDALRATSGGLHQAVQEYIRHIEPTPLDCSVPDGTPQSSKPEEP